MRATALAFLSLAALGSPGAARAQVQLYGTVDLAYGVVATQPPGPPTAPINRIHGVHNGGIQTSYIGFRAMEDLGGGLRARVQLEAFLRADTGMPGRFDATPAAGSDPFFSRESYVGLAGAFGEVRLGNNAHPTWVALIQSSALGANSVFSPGFRQLFNGGARGRSEVDTSMVNSAKVQTPTLAGFSASWTTQFREGSGTGANHSGQVLWRGGPFFATAAFSRIRHAALPNAAGARNQDIALAGASWDFGAAKVFAQYTTIDNARLATKDRVPHVGLTLKAGDFGTVQLARAEDKNTTATRVTTRRTTTTAGYVHALSRRTELYTFVMHEALPVGNAGSRVLGIRHQF